MEPKNIVEEMMSEIAKIYDEAREALKADFSSGKEEE